MKNRTRDVRIPFFLSEHELEVLEKNIETSGKGNRSAYIRKMILDGYIVTFDFAEVRELSSQLCKIENNVKQIVRVGSQSDDLSQNQVNETMEWLEEISEYHKKIITLIIEIINKG